MHPILQRDRRHTSFQLADAVLPSLRLSLLPSLPLLSLLDQQIGNQTQVEEEHTGGCLASNQYQRSSWHIGLKTCLQPSSATIFRVQEKKSFCCEQMRLVLSSHCKHQKVVKCNLCILWSSVQHKSCVQPPSRTYIQVSLYMPVVQHMCHSNHSFRVEHT